MRYKKVFLIGNPIAGGGALKKIKKVESFLSSLNIDFETYLTKKAGDAEIFARLVKEKNLSDCLVLVAGGDGTYNEVVNGLAFSEIPMAILPMGTSSVLAREIKLTNNLESAFKSVLSGKPHKIHLGKIKNSEKERLFILMAGVGFDGEAVYGVKKKEKQYLGKIAYFLSGIRTIIKYSPDLLKIVNSNEKTAYTAVVAKASCYGGSFKIAPDARLDEPIFYVFLSKTQRRLTLLYHILGVIIGKNIKMKQTDYFKTEKLKILGNAHVQIDGDYFGKAPVEIEIVKNGINLVFPEGN